MDCYTIASPDKLSISMFLNFMRYGLRKKGNIGKLHSFMNEESISLFVNDLMSNNTDVIFSYYAKKQQGKKPIDIIPSKLLQVSNLVIWMDLYSVDWFIVSDKMNIANSIKQVWNQRYLSAVQPVY